jgi:hypothetical protein
MPVYVPGVGWEDRKCWKVSKDGEDVCPWSSTAGSWDVDYCFEKIVRKGLLMVLGGLSSRDLDV